MHTQVLHKKNHPASPTNHMGARTTAPTVTLQTGVLATLLLVSVHLYAQSATKAQPPAVPTTQAQPAGPGKAAAPAAPAVRTLRIQSARPAGNFAQEHLKFVGERLEKLTGGQLRIETMFAGQVVPAFEILDAASKRIIDGGHSISYYWVGKNKATVLYSGPPGGPFGMDHTDFLGWMWEGGGQQMWTDLYQKTMKLNLVVFPAHPISPQAFGWFKRPIKDLRDFKTMKCRQTGINAEIFNRMGMQTVDMPGGEILPAAQRGVIDCAEWVGGIEDLRLGFHNVWKFHYTPGVHENNTIGEIFINADVWKSLPALHQEAFQSATREAFLVWSTRFQKQNADALKEFQEKHGVKVLRTPPDILNAYLKAWDGLSAEESQRNPAFKQTLDSQRAWASVVVPAKRFMTPPYNFVANYYWPEAGTRAQVKMIEKK